MCDKTMRPALLLRWRMLDLVRAHACTSPQTHATEKNNQLVLATMLMQCSKSCSQTASNSADAMYLQPRVQVSPIIMIVAVAVPSLPPQHSPMFGHFASSHTVAKPSSLTVLRSFW
jgi:hypothetical protein